VEGFTKKYNITKLVYYEICPDANAGIAKKKQIKGGSRRNKEDLIKSMNPEWKDLYESLLSTISITPSCQSEERIPL
jgi:putative endonuclease